MHNIANMIPYNNNYPRPFFTKSSVNLLAPSMRIASEKAFTFMILLDLTDNTTSRLVKKVCRVIFTASQTINSHLDRLPILHQCQYYTSVQRKRFSRCELDVRQPGRINVSCKTNKQDAILKVEMLIRNAQFYFGVSIQNIVET